MALLEVKAVGKIFGGLRAVNEVSVAVGERELVGLIGPNGAGKTTLFNLVTGHERPSHGEIFWLGQRIDGKRPHEVARRGLVRTFQNPMVFQKVSVKDNLSIAESARTKPLLPSLRERVIDTCGLRPVLEQKPENLPYGVKRRLGIALALLMEPRMLLLDEPAAGLNQAERVELRELLEALWKGGLALVVVEHDMKLVMSLCKRIVVLDAGQLIEDGPPDKVLSNPVVARIYLGKAKVKAGADHAQP